MTFLLQTKLYKTMGLALIQTTVWWSAQACSRRCASSSTGGVRLRLKTRKPVAAAQNAPTIQRTFFIGAAPFFFSFRVRIAALSLQSYDASGGLDAAKF